MSLNTNYHGDEIMTCSTTPEVLSAVSDILRFFERPTLLRARRNRRSGREADITVCESHLRILGHSADVVNDAVEHVLSCARLPRE